MHYVAESTIAHSLTTVDNQPAVWLGGPGCARHELVGEENNPQQMQRVLQAVHGRTDTVLPAWLVPESQHPHEPTAVAVFVLGGKVGYLPRDLGFGWQPVVSQLQARYGRHVACQATLDPPSAANRGGYGMLVWLPPMSGAQPSLSDSAPYSAPGRTIAGAPDESARVRAELDMTRAELEAAKSELRAAAARLAAATRPADELAAIASEVKETKAALAAAKRELDSVEEALDIQSFGFYTPKYGFESSAHYTARLKGIREEQKVLIKEGKAAPCDTTWSVGGSKAEGKKMVRQQAKLMLRAFNGESDAAIAKVRYDNVTKLEERLTKAYNEINKLGEVQRVFISRRYFELKLAELHLVHEHREKVHEEKVEQKRIRDQLREEQKVQQEIERAKAEAEASEAQSAAALEKARAELEAEEATSKQHERLEALVHRLETELKDALDRKAKAIARAQLTKSGYVYVLSNIGSFGEGIFKLGMTRRLDPLERVTELGDASVPFPFDVHAIVYSEDAPSLEAKLHQAFASRRVNLINTRKEYFRVTLAEIQQELTNLHGLVTFQLTPEAEEFRKTQAALAATTS